MDIDPLSAVPTYRQLAAALRARIEAGELAPGKPLPSLTTLVQETGLSVGTIRRAEALLVAEGLVVVAPGRGAYVRRQDG